MPSLLPRSAPAGANGVLNMNRIGAFICPRPDFCVTVLIHGKQVRDHASPAAVAAFAIRQQLGGQSLRSLAYGVEQELDRPRRVAYTRYFAEDGRQVAWVEVIVLPELAESDATLTHQLSPRLLDTFACDLPVEPGCGWPNNDV